MVKDLILFRKTVDGPHLYGSYVYGLHNLLNQKLYFDSFRTLTCSMLSNVKGA